MIAGHFYYGLLLTTHIRCTKLLKAPYLSIQEAVEDSHHKALQTE